MLKSISVDFIFGQINSMQNDHHMKCEINQIGSQQLDFKIESSKIGYTTPTMNWFLRKEGDLAVLTGKYTTNYGTFNTEFGVRDSSLAFETVYSKGKAKFQLIPRLRPELYAHLEHVEPLHKNLSLRINAKTIPKKNPVLELALEGFSRTYTIYNKKLIVACDFLYGQQIDLKWSMQLGNIIFKGTNISDRQLTIGTETCYVFAKQKNTENKVGMVCNVRGYECGILATESFAQLRTAKDFGTIQVAADLGIAKKKISDLSLAASMSKRGLKLDTKWTMTSKETLTRVSYTWNNFEAALSSKFGPNGFITSSWQIVRNDA